MNTKVHDNNNYNEKNIGDNNSYATNNKDVLINEMNSKFLVKSINNNE